MLQGRLISISRLAAAASVVTLVLSSCSGEGAIRENVIEPGITAIDRAGELQCSQDASTLRVALDVYETLEGVPAASEQELIDGQFIREPSEVWDVVDGELVAADPGCGEVPQVPVSEIVTSTEPSLSADDFLTGFGPAEIEAVGGIECATELAAIFAAGTAYPESAGEPDDFQDFVDAGLLDALPTLWATNGTELVPAEGSGCVLPQE